MFCIFKGLAHLLISPVLVDVRLLSCLVFKTMLIIYLLRAAAERRDVLTLLKPLAPLRSPARLYLEMLG